MQRTPPPKPQSRLSKNSAASAPSGPQTPDVHVDFDLGGDDVPTRERNARVILYQRLVACVDELDVAGATDLVEIACLHADMTREERATFLRVARAIQRP